MIKSCLAVEDLVKVGDELVEHAQELPAALEGLVVQLVEVDEVGEDDADVAVVLRVVLRQRLCERLLARHVVGDDVVEQPVRLGCYSLLS